MRIAMVAENAGPLASPARGDASGPDARVGELSDALSRRGHQVFVYPREPDASTAQRFSTRYGTTVVPAPGEQLGQFTQFLLGEWSEDPPELVHAHCRLSGLASIVAANQLGLPVVQAHHTLGSHQSEESVEAERTVGRHADRVIAASLDELGALVELGVPRSRISVVPDGVDPATFTPNGPVAERGAPQRLLAVGELEPRNGFTLAIAALRNLRDTELVIAGGPAKSRLKADPEADRLRRFAAHCGVADRVHLIGHVPRRRLPKLLRSADLMVCTPAYESFGTASIEAMACGVPVLATAVGGLAETVVDGITGCYVPPDRPSALRATISTVLTDPGRHVALSVAARDRACARYSWDRVAEETVEVYDRVLRDRAAQVGSSPRCGSAGTMPRQPPLS